VLASTLPNLGSPGTPALMSIVFGFCWTAQAYLRGHDRDDIRWAGFQGTFFGAGIGLLSYAFGLITGLY
jgi:hypothetical protein